MIRDAINSLQGRPRVQAPDGLWNRHRNSRKIDWRPGKQVRWLAKITLFHFAIGMFENLPPFFQVFGVVSLHVHRSRRSRQNDRHGFRARRPKDSRPHAWWVDIPAHLWNGVEMTWVSLVFQWQTWSRTRTRPRTTSSWWRTSSPKTSSGRPSCSRLPCPRLWKDWQIHTWGGELVFCTSSIRKR